MNKKGFTLVELIATLVLLGIVAGITIVSVSGIFKTAKEKSEDVFVDTIRDSIEMFMSSEDSKKLNFIDGLCPSINKSYKSGIKVYKSTVEMSKIISNGSLTQDNFVNPANEGQPCNSVDEINVNIYRDEDFVYYYSVDKRQFGCLINDGVISNLPEGYSC